MTIRNKGYFFAWLLFFATGVNASFYVTGGAGATQTTANWDIATTVFFPSPTSQTAQYTLPYATTSSEEDQSGIGQLGVGYGKRFSNAIFLGLEASITGFAPQPDIENKAIMTDTYQIGNPPSPPISAQLISNTTLKVVNPDININLKLGRSLTRYAMLYAKGGVVFNELELESNTSFLYVNNTVTGSAPKSLTSVMNATETKKVTGFNAVLGIEQLINRHMAVNFEYSYVNYGSISLEAIAPVSSTTAGGNQVNVDPDGLRTDNSATVDRQSVMLGVIFYFSKQYQ